MTDPGPAPAHREIEELASVARLLSETLDLSMVGERITERVMRLLGTQSSALRLLRPDGSLEAIALGGKAKTFATVRTVVPSGFGNIGRAVLEGRPIWSADVRLDAEISPATRQENVASGILANLAVPLRVTGRVIGALSVGSAEPRHFTEAEIELLQSFADHAALAIHHAQTQAALARQAERLRIMHQIDRALIAEQAPLAIAEAVVGPLRELLGVPRVIVNLFDLETGQVEWLAAAGRRRIRTGPGVRYSLRLAGDVEALRRGEPQVIDVHTLGPTPEAAALLASGVTIYMVVPMIAGGELIGSVSLGDTDGRFPPERVAIAQEVATQLAIAMTQARLHERVTRQAAELERRVEERTHELRAATAEADRANQAKSEFLSRMSHELRTPLNAVLGFAQLLEMDALSPRQAESVAQILRAGRHLLGLIDEVLEISRIEAGRLRLSVEPVPVHDTLRQAIELIRPSATGQDVAVSVEPVAADRLRITVTDTGEGIGPDKIARLFTPFDRLGAEASPIEGTGLGLALSKTLVEAMGGAIHVESRPGQGSRFGVELSLVPDPGARVDTIASPRDRLAVATLAQPRTVLYLEDNLSNLRLVESVLARRPGVTVLSAMQGRVGLELASAHRPDLILLDRHLPDMTGDDVFAQLRADPRTRAIPVVILSADAIASGTRHLIEAGVRAYLTKPLDIQALLTIIDDTFRLPTPKR